MLNVLQHAAYLPRTSRLRVRAGRRLKPVRPSRAAELWYRNRLTEVVSAMRAEAKRVLLAELRPLATPGVADASPFDRALDRLARSKPFNSLKLEAQQLAGLAAKKARFWVDDRLAREVSRSLRVDVRAAMTSQGSVAAKMQAAVEWNTSLISTLPDRFIDDLREKLEAGWGSGLRVGAIEDLVDDVVEAAGDNCESNAGLIARDQMNKMNAAFNQARQTELGIRRYIWRTSEDERVRPDHQELDGQEFSWDEDGPLAGTIDGRPCHPGEDIQCRCDAIPVFDLEEEAA